MKKEVTMYKLAIVGIVLSGVLMSAAIAQAKPVGMSKAEHRALVIRSEGLNQKYGVGQKSQQPIIREKLGEIGAWAVPSTSTSTQQPTVREKLGEIGAWAVPSTSTSTPTPVVSSDDGFDWNSAGIGAAFVFGAMLLGVASLVTRRRHHRPVAH
jgi:uncharacterized protein (TIGR03382 family)